jgi:hypothetical protein
MSINMVSGAPKSTNTTPILQRPREAAEQTMEEISSAVTDFFTGTRVQRPRQRTDERRPGGDSGQSGGSLAELIGGSVYRGFGPDISYSTEEMGGTEPEAAVTDEQAPLVPDETGRPGGIDVRK